MNRISFENFLGDVFYILFFFVGSLVRFFLCLVLMVLFFFSEL